MEVNPYAGIWQSIGHGEILEISGEEAYAFYDITSISCVSRRTGPLAEITQALSLDSDTLSLSVGVITTRYTRTSTLPIPCRHPIGTDQANDPQYNYEVFMATVKEHYAQSSILSLHSHHLE